MSSFLCNFLRIYSVFISLHSTVRDSTCSMCFFTCIHKCNFLFSTLSHTWVVDIFYTFNVPSHTHTLEHNPKGPLFTKVVLCCLQKINPKFNSIGRWDLLGSGEIMKAEKGGLALLSFHLFFHTENKDFFFLKNYHIKDAILSIETSPANSIGGCHDRGTC